MAARRILAGPFYSFWSGHRPTCRGPLSIAPALKANTPLLALELWMAAMSPHVAVNGISSHRRPAWNKLKKRETEKVQRIEAVENIVDLIAQVRERGDTETVEKLTRARIWRILFRCLISPRWIGTATKTMTTETELGNISLPPTHASMSRDFIATSDWNRTTRACSINWSKLLEASLCRICLADSNSDPNLDLGPDTPYHRLEQAIPRGPSNLLCHRRSNSSQSLQYHPPLLPIPVSTPSRACFPAPSQLTALGRGIFKAPSRFRRV